VAGRTPQTMAKRAREQAVKEKRELKRAKKLEGADERAAARAAAAAERGVGDDSPTG
jgi:hypothetical protein